MQAVLDALVARQPVDLPVALVAAHPDDETIGAGVAMTLFPHLLLVHVTDGAPRDGGDAARHGFATPAEYAAARRAELHAALATGGIQAQRAELGVPDQAASLAMPALARRLAALLGQHGTRVVITHPYEGGHPDHDATALIVRMAVDAMPRPPAILEMTSYHAGPHGWQTGCFLPGPPSIALPLSADDAVRKRAMFACHRSQAEVLVMFDATLAAERFRPAPRYDFRRPPHPGPLNYEGFGWDWTGERWRRLAAAALDGAALDSAAPSDATERRPCAS